MTSDPIQPETVNPKAVLVNLKKSGLLTKEQLQNAAKSLDSKSTEKPSSQRLLAYLLDTEVLSHWQYRQLAIGKYKGFFLGNFTLRDLLGVGGMSAVFLAEHKLTGQRRAIKVLPKKKKDQRSYLARFYREGRTVASLQHSNIIRIYDISNDEDTHFMVMEYVNGIDLYAKVQKEGVADFDFARDAIIQAARGLQHAHQNNLVHRDVKPANLFLTEGGIIKVLDLGLALFKSDDHLLGLSAQHNETMMGTADYLAPEQAVHSHNLDHRADIYSLGCTLYYLLTGQPPFNQGTLAQRIAAHQNSAPESIDGLRPQCPDDLVRICQKMMVKDPAGRFQTCADIIVALEGRVFVETRPQTKILVERVANRPTTPTPNLQTNQAAKTKRKHLPIVLLLACSILLVIVLAILVLQNQ